MPEDALKLIVTIVSDSDAERLIQKLVSQGYPATRIGGSGGFLRRGTSTILSGVEASDVDPVLALIRSECSAHTQRIAAPPLFPMSVETETGRQVEVRVGGAIIFVLPVDRFERT